MIVSLNLVSEPADLRISEAVLKHHSSFLHSLPSFFISFYCTSNRYTVSDLDEGRKDEMMKKEKNMYKKLGYLAKVQ